MFSYATDVAIYGGEFHAYGRDESRLPGSQGFNALQQQVMHDAFHDAYTRHHFPRWPRGTHTSPLNVITDWINAPTNNKAHVMWLNGNNADTSTIAQAIADRCSDPDARLLLAAFFFSGSSDVETRSLLPTIAYQIAIKRPELRSAIGQAVENDPLIFERTPDIQMRQLIMEPLKLVASHSDLSTFPRLIVIDGLQTCSVQMQHSIISILADSLSNYKFSLMFLISSLRKESISNAFMRYLEISTQPYTNFDNNRLCFHDLSINPSRHSSIPSITIQTSLPVDPQNVHPPTVSPILLRSPTTGRIPIVDHSIRTLKQYKHPPHSLDNSSDITCVKSSPDDHTLLVGTADGTLRVWNTVHCSLKNEHRFSQSQTGMVIDVAHSSSSYLKYAVILQDLASPTTSVYAVLNDRKWTKIRVESNLPPLSHIYALANGTILAPYYIQGRVFLKSWKMKKHGNGNSSWDESVTLSDLAGLRDTLSSSNTFSGCTFCMSPDEKTFWTVTKSGCIVSSKIKNGHQASEVLHLPSSYPTIQTASTSSHRADHDSYTSPPQENVGQRPATVIPSLSPHYFITPEARPESPIRLACSPDPHCQRLAVSLASGEILLWDVGLKVVKTMRESQMSLARTRGASPITFSTDGKYLIYACNEMEKTIKIQDIATSTISSSILLHECPADNDISFIATAKDFKHIIVSFQRCRYSLLFRWS